MSNPKSNDSVHIEQELAMAYLLAASETYASDDPRRKSLLNARQIIAELDQLELDLVTDSVSPQDSTLDLL